MKKKFVVLSGAGISAESGIKTFRDANGLWENHRIEDVASPEGFRQNPELVLEFYNLRRRQLHEVVPNEAHKILAELENDYDVQIITQNVDDLHERAGSTKVLHLHGELLKARAIEHPEKILSWPHDLKVGDVNSDGDALRPHIVWFGEDVPELQYAVELVSQADIFLIIGTSLQVYPAAGLIHEVKNSCEVYIIDPNLDNTFTKNENFLKMTASAGMKVLKQILNERK